ncbi:MAG TPA: hypothetical protein ENN80_15365 [Candidatus Hydrogenedentes bacterium]|nr:hypothetical protein [Candidatus Hydrogenedentota bacterium]
MSNLFFFRFLMAQPNSGAAAAFNLPIEERGAYDIYVYFAERDDLARDTPITVHHADGVVQLALNQTQSGNWPRLGCWPL